MFTCTSCGFSTAEIETAAFCPNCRIRISGTTRIIDATSETQIEATGKSLVKYADQVDLAGDLLRQMEKMYLSREAIEKDNPVWNKFGKHLTAYKYKRQAVKTLQKVGQARADFLVEGHEQIFSIELERQAQILRDAIEEERFDRLKELEVGRAEIHAIGLDTDGLSIFDFLEKAALKLSSPAFKFLSDDDKSDLIMDLYQARKAAAFRIAPPPQNPSLTDSGFDNIETDFDE